ncbi:MAG: hypothetical protein NVSMB25_09470 [Thermoleophilaceae bacterium]
MRFVLRLEPERAPPLLAPPSEVDEPVRDGVLREEPRAEADRVAGLRAAGEEARVAGLRAAVDKADDLRAPLDLDEARAVGLAADRAAVVP